MFRLFEKRERERKNEERVIKVYALHLRLKNSGIMGEKSPYRRRIQERMVMFWPINKNLVEFEIIIRDYC